MESCRQCGWARCTRERQIFQDKPAGIDMADALFAASTAIGSRENLHNERAWGGGEAAASGGDWGRVTRSEAGDCADYQIEIAPSR
jgi:hypothetical protein